MVGVERHHQKSDETENEEQGLGFSTVRMKDANGFRESKIVPQNYTPTSKYAFFNSPSGFVVNLVQHIAK